MNKRSVNARFYQVGMLKNIFRPREWEKTIADMVQKCDHDFLISLICDFFSQIGWGLLLYKCIIECLINVFGGLFRHTGERGKAL